MRTLSARILLGFAALTVTFGVITATVVFNMSLVENQVTMIGKGFVPLALACKDLADRQEDLRDYLEGGLLDESSQMSAKLQINRNRTNRDRELKGARRILDSVYEVSKTSGFDPARFADVAARVSDIEAMRETLGDMYKAVLAAPPVGPQEKYGEAEKAAFDTLIRLRLDERKMKVKTSELSERLDSMLKQTTSNLQRNQAKVRMATLGLGSAAVLLGLGITVWVVITLRPLRRLREGARRIAAGDYASRIPEKGPAEVSDLAREFNSMGRAVEERERELVRSERLVAVGKMAALITHEVRNPLSSISLNTELLEDELNEEAVEARSLVRSIHQEIDRLTAITEDYLAFARLPKPKLAPEPVHPIITSLVEFVREDLATRKVTLTTELAAEHLMANVDAGQIRQCLINLVRNAADAVAAKGAGIVTLKTRRDGDKVAIEVVDDGVGIPPEALPHVFDPFFSTKEGGNGLGLALTHEIVREHAGDLDVRSTVGRGTTFTLRVPLHVAGRG